MGDILGNSPHVSSRIHVSFTAIKTAWSQHSLGVSEVCTSQTQTSATLYTNNVQSDSVESGGE